MVCSWGDCKPTATMLAVVVVFAVMNTLTKMAFNEGMHITVLITLRQLTAMLFLAPIAYFRERASLTQWLFFVGLQYTSATFACAFINMTPMFTFLVALPFGLEKLDMKTRAGIAKVTGTFVGFTGAMLLALYQGPSLTELSSPPPMDHVVGTSQGQGAHRWVIGSVALLAGSACWSFWFILQSRIGKKYPALYSGTAFMFLLSFLQMAVVGLASEKSFSVWILRSKLQIITVLFVGIMGSGLGFLAMSWCIEQRGPVFTTAFTPLIQIIAAGMNIIVLHEQLHVGRRAEQSRAEQRGQRGGSEARPDPADGSGDGRRGEGAQSKAEERGWRRRKRRWASQAMPKVEEQGAHDARR